MTRRTYGTGTVRQLPSGRWQVRAHDPRTGRQVPGPTTYRTKREAERELPAHVTALRQGTVASAAAPTVRQWLTTWQESVQRQVERGERSPETARSLRSRLNRIGREIGHVRLDRLQTGDLDAMYERLLDEGKKASTVREYHHAASGALSEAVRLGLLPRNPAEGAWNRRRVDRRPVTTPEHDDILKLLTAAAETDPMLADAIEVAAMTGCREGEVLALRWSDLDGSRLRVGAAVKRALEGGIVLGETKTRTVEYLDLGADHVAAFERMRAERDALCLAVGAPVTDEDCFVISWDYTSRTYSSPNTLVNRFRKLTRQMGCPEVRFHDLRDYAGMAALEAGNVSVAQQRLRHSTPSTTLDRYLRGKSGSNAARRAAELLPGFSRK